MMTDIVAHYYYVVELQEYNFVLLHLTLAGILLNERLDVATGQRMTE